MTITFNIPNTEIIMTTGQTNAKVQDLVNAIRLFESQFEMMGRDYIIDAFGKAALGGGVFTEIVMVLRNPWTLRFADEASAHTSVTGGTTLAFESDGVTPRPVTTNFALTINQSISGTLVETGVSGLTAAESAKLTETNQLLRNKRVLNIIDGIETIYADDNVTPLFTRAVWVDAAGIVQYDGTLVPHRVDRYA